MTRTAYIFGAGLRGMTGLNKHRLDVEVAVGGADDRSRHGRYGVQPPHIELAGLCHYLVEQRDEGRRESHEHGTPCRRGLRQREKVGPLTTGADARRTIVAELGAGAALYLEAPGSY